MSFHHVAVLALAAAMAVAARAEEPAILSDEPAGFVSVDGEMRLVVEGISGEIYVGDGAPGEVRYASMTLDANRTPVRIALSLGGPEFRLFAAPGAPPARRFLQVAVPHGMALVLDLSDAVVRVSSLSGDLEVRGSRVSLSGRRIAGPVTLDLATSGVDLSDIEGQVAVRGADVDLKLEGTGRASLNLTRGSAAVANTRGGMTAQLDSVGFSLDGVQGPSNIRANGGSVRAAGLGGESVIRLERSPLEIRGNTDDVEVSTDADVRFADLRGPLHVDSYGGAVTGTGAGDLLEVMSQGPSVEVSGAAGPIRVFGSGLTVRIRGVREETLIYTGSSDVTVEDASGPLAIENEVGSIAVRRASGPVEVLGRKCDVRLEELSGTLDLQADGNTVEVGWSACPKDGESLVKNDGGGVSMTLPAAGGCRVEARTAFGRVDSELAALTADETGKSAAGNVGGGGPAVIRIVANGDVSLLVARPKEVPRREGPKLELPGRRPAG